MKLNNTELLRSLKLLNQKLYKIIIHFFMNSSVVLMTISLLLVFHQNANANWSWNIGYHNPPNSTVGLNFMKQWSNWAFEAGIGYLGSSESNSNSSSNSTTNSSSTSNTQNSAQVSTSGDLNIKYLFGSGTFRPYLQGGVGTAAGVSTSTKASASAGNNFLGAGFYLMGSSFYFYTAYITSGDGSLQLGLGFQ